MAVKGAFDHQDVPFQQIAELPGLSRTRLARCFVSVQNTTPLDLVLPGIESSYEDVPTDTANFDLAVVLEEQGHTFRGWVDAKADAWSPAALDRFIQGFLASLERVTDAPGHPLTDSPEGSRLRGGPAAPGRRACTSSTATKRTGRAHPQRAGAADDRHLGGRDGPAASHPRQPLLRAGRSFAAGRAASSTGSAPPLAARSPWPRCSALRPSGSSAS